MERKFIFVCILLVMLSTINAIPLQLHKRATAFQKCGKIPGALELAVTMTPDPPVPGNPSVFEVSGKLGKDISEGSILSIGLLDYTAGDTPKAIYGFNGKICPVLGCPYPAGTPLYAKAEVPVPAVLPDSYTIVVAIINPEVDKVAVGCSFATVGKTAKAAGPDSAALFSLVV